MTTIVLGHPNEHCPRFQIFGVYEGQDDRFVFGVRESEDQTAAKRIAHRMMAYHEADHFERVVRQRPTADTSSSGAGWCFQANLVC